MRGNDLVNYYEDEEEIIGEDRGVFPDLIDYLDLFTKVKEITLDCDNSKTSLVIKLDNGIWSFFVFYDVEENPLKAESHKKLLDSLGYYLGEM